MVTPNVNFAPWRTPPRSGGPCNGGQSPPSHVASGSFMTYGTSDSQPVTVANVPNRILVFVFVGEGRRRLAQLGHLRRAAAAAARRARPGQRAARAPVPRQPAGRDRAAGVDEDRRATRTSSGATASTRASTRRRRGGAGGARRRRATRPARRASSSHAQSGDLVVDGVVFNGPNGVGSGPVAGAGQSQRWSTRLSTTQGGSSDKLAASPVTMTWTPSPGTGNGLDWALIGAPLQPAAGGGGPLPSTTSTQSSTTATDVAPGTSVTDTATVTGAGPVPTGTVTFFLCQPATVTANGGNCHDRRRAGRRGEAARRRRVTRPPTRRRHDHGRHLLLAGRLLGRRDATTARATAARRTSASRPRCRRAAAADRLPVGGLVLGLRDERLAAGDGAGDGEPDPRLRVRRQARLRHADLGHLRRQPLQLLAARSQGSVRLELRYLVNPPAGTAQLAWTKSGASQNVTWGYSVYSGVNQATPFGAPVQAGASGDGGGAKSARRPGVVRRPRRRRGRLQRRVRPGGRARRPAAGQTPAGRGGSRRRRAARRTSPARPRRR